MKKIILKIGILAVLAIVVLPTLQVLAQSNEYTVLAPLPGVGDEGGTTTLAKYIPAIFNLAIGLSAAFAVLMIVIGGFQYITTDAILGKQQGIERIKNSVFGLVLVISAWLILYTINPKLLELNLNIEPVTVTAPPGGEAGPSGNFDPGIEAQVADASPVLANFLGCVWENLPSGVGRISSISDSNNRVGTLGFDRCKTCPKGTQIPECAHVCQSCHYGGGSANQSYAVDFGDEENSMVIGNTIISCANELNISQNSIGFINEGNHLHYEIGCPK